MQLIIALALLAQVPADVAKLIERSQAMSKDERAAFEAPTREKIRRLRREATILKAAPVGEGKRFATDNDRKAAIKPVNDEIATLSQELMDLRAGRRLYLPQLLSFRNPGDIGIPPPGECKLIRIIDKEGVLMEWTGVSLRRGVAQPSKHNLFLRGTAEKFAELPKCIKVVGTTRLATETDAQALAFIIERFDSDTATTYLKR